MLARATIIHIVTLLPLAWYGSHALGQTASQKPPTGEQGASEIDGAPEINGASEGLDELRDPAFQQFVDLRLVQQGLVEQDPSLLTDAALQMAQGERVLLRRHKAVTADRLLQVAIYLAVELQDRETVDRLLRAAQRLEKEDLVARLEAAQKLLAASRERELSVAVDAPAGDLSAEASVLYRAYRKKIRVATAIGDRSELERLREAVHGLTELSDERRAELQSKIDQALGALAGNDPTGSDALHRLARGGGSPENPGSRRSIDR